MGMKNKGENGFTLIELLVVIAIISLLASVVFAGLQSARAKGRDVRRKADIKTLQTALELYVTDNGVYPPVVDDRGDGWDQSYDGTFMPNLVPKYLPSQATDPHGTGDAYQSYYYRFGNYSSPPFCPGTPQMILHFYLETEQDSKNYVLCSVQTGPYGHCLCLY